MFVLTSNNEGSPNTVAEALRAGKPVIATDCTDLSEMVDEGRNGFIIPVGDAAALEERMERILVMTESEVMAMREHSRQLFQETFLLEQTVEELLELYTELLRETW